MKTNHLFYGLDRFSVDLDFDLLDKNKDEQVFEHAKNILESYGTIKDSRKKDTTFSICFHTKIKNSALKI